MAYVVSERLHIALVGEVLHAACTALALGYVQMIGLGSERLVLPCIGIEIGERDGRDVVLAGIAGHRRKLVLYAALSTTRGNPRILGHLRVVGVEVGRELYLRLLQQLEVTHAADGHLRGQHVVGAQVLVVHLGGHLELAHTTGEAGRLVGQRVDLQIDGRSHDNLLRIAFGSTAVEELLEGVDAVVQLHDGSLELYGRYAQVACLLGEQHVLSPDEGRIVAAVILFALGAALLFGVAQLLNIERCLVGQVA